jgi:hypothetical protein
MRFEDEKEKKDGKAVRDFAFYRARTLSECLDKTPDMVFFGMMIVSFLIIFMFGFNVGKHDEKRSLEKLNLYPTDHELYEAEKWLQR